MYPKIVRANEGLQRIGHDLLVNIYEMFPHMFPEEYAPVLPEGETSLLGP